MHFRDIFVDAHFRADDFRGYALSWQSNFVDVHFRADVFCEYEISGRWVSGLYNLTITTVQPEPTNLNYPKPTTCDQQTQTDQHKPDQTN